MHALVCVFDILFEYFSQNRMIRIERQTLVDLCRSVLLFFFRQQRAENKLKCPRKVRL